jgi:hypothetical protein
MSSFSTEKNQKIQKTDHPMPLHLSPSKNNSENSSSMSHHISLLKNTSKNLRKSPHATTPFSIEK